MHPIRALCLVLAAARPAAAELPGGELYGDGRPVAVALAAEAAAKWPLGTTAREGRDFGYRLEVPDGSYRLELGLPEPVWRRAGQRVFSIALDGNIVLKDVDLVARVGRAPSLAVVEVDVEVRGGALDVRFIAGRENAIAGWLTLTPASGSAGGPPVAVDCGGEVDLPAAYERAELGSVVLPRFGSRAFLELRPQWGDFCASALGKFREVPVPAIFGFRTARATYALPVAGRHGDALPFDRVRERRSVTGVRYEVEFEGLRGTIEFRAPFHPGDLVLSQLPWFWLDFALETGALPEPAGVAAVVRWPGAPGRQRNSAIGSDLRGIVVEAEGPEAGTSRGLFAIGASGAAGAGVELKANPRSIGAVVPLGGAAPRARFGLALLARGPVLTRDGVPEALAAARHWGSIEDVALEAWRSRATAEQASAVVDGLIADAILPGDLRDLAVAALPSFLLNTVLTADAEGRPFYSCLEGYCRYHSTLDVEYNAAPFYLWFAPELLRAQLDTWPRYLDGDVMPHDVGELEHVAGPAYGHPMPVEENANYVALLWAYWTARGDAEFVLAKAGLVERLLDRIGAADLDQDGLPDLDTANTLDDASAAVQYGREQTYLSVKCAAAFHCGAEILSAAGDAAAAERQRARAVRALEAVESRAWRDGHYAVCADSSAEGLVDPWQKKAVPLGPGVLPGADGASPHTAVGLLWLLRGGAPPLLDGARLSADLAAGSERTARRFADAHSEVEDNGWVSQNLFRDAVACYLGTDVLERSSRYARLQRYRARAPDLPDWAGFCDSYYNRHLSYYPRGAAVLALIDAAAGLVVDRRSGRVTLRPVRAPLRVPLAAFADWPNLRVPWFEVTAGADGAPAAGIAEGDLLRGLDVTIDLSLIGGELAAWRAPEGAAK